MIFKCTKTIINDNNDDTWNNINFVSYPCWPFESYQWWYYSNIHIHDDSCHQSTLDDIYLRTLNQTNHVDKGYCKSRQNILMYMLEKINGFMFITLPKKKLKETQQILNHQKQIKINAWHLCKLIYLTCSSKYQ